MEADAGRHRAGDGGEVRHVGEHDRGRFAAELELRSLHLRRADFDYVRRHPAGVAVGMLAQFVLLPLVTLGATLLLDLPAPVEAAMILVACVPGGALSNVITHFAGGNLALSVSISAASSVAALVLTPLNFSWMVAANPVTAQWAAELSADPTDLAKNLVLLLGLPMGLAMLLRAKRPALATRLRAPLEKFALICLGLFIVAAVATQWRAFVAAITQVLPLVVAHNALGLGLGAGAAKLCGLPRADLRAVTIESGMQNAGLAMGIIASQFSADVQMTAIAATWGIWHIVSGWSLAQWWRWHDRREAASPGP